MLNISPTQWKIPKGFTANIFNTSLKKKVKLDALISYAMSFRGKGGIYRYIDALGVTPNWQQDELIAAYDAGEPRIACRAGKGPGKTMATAIIFTHWSMVWPKSNLIVTAPTYRQCKGVWLSQAKALIYSSVADKRLGQLFHFVGTGYGILGSKPDEWGCQLITALTKEAFQGLHEKYMAFLEEEASGVRPDISEAIKETITNSKGSWLHVRIGNPNSRLCAFFDSFYKEKDNWCCLHWNTEKTTETEYFSHRRNEEIAKEYGKSSDIYKISVKGDFPSLDPNCLISEEHLDACCTDEALRRASQDNEDDKKQIGIDLARYGGDENVVVTRQGGIMFEMWAEKTDPNNAIDKAVFNQNQYGWEDDDCLYVVDTSGMGEAVVGVLGGSKYMGKKVHEFYAQNTAYESNKFENKISEAWCLFAKLVKFQLVYLGEKLDKKLKNQLVTRRYSVNRKSGRIQIESKDDYMKNNKDLENGTIGKSPDRADAIVMAFYKYASESTRIAVG